MSPGLRRVIPDQSRQGRLDGSAVHRSLGRPRNLVSDPCSPSPTLAPARAQSFSSNPRNHWLRLYV